jgi:ubiquitin-conjugating enzyme E2 W
MAAMSSKRLQKELVKVNSPSATLTKPTLQITNQSTQIQGTLPPGITLVSAPDLKEWQMDIAVLDNPIYPPTDLYR